MGFAEGSEEVLHMVADFMGDDVGVGKIAVGTQLFLHVHKELKVEIDALVGRAVERSRLGGGAATAALDGIGEKNQLGWDVGLAHLFKFGSPHIFRSSENLLGEGGQFLFFCAGHIFGVLGGGSGTARTQLLENA